MDNRSLSYLTILVVGLIALLLASHLMPFSSPLGSSMGEKYIAFKDVSKITLERKDSSYTLNSEQQNTMIKYLNQAIPVAPTTMETHSSPIDFDKITLYRVDNHSPIVLTPLAYENGGNLFFKAPDWNTQSILKDVSGNKLKMIINHAFESPQEKKDTLQ